MAFFDDAMSAVGSVGDALSAPRRFLWGDAKGTDILSNTFGADPDSGLTQAGGILLEMLMDPLTYLTPIGIGAAAKGIPAIANVLGKTSKIASASDDIARLAAVRAAAQKASTLAQFESEAATAANAARLNALRGVADVPGIASGSGMAYQRATPEAAEALSRLGLGAPTESGGAAIFQGRLPQGIGVQRGGAGGGSRIGVQRGASLPEQGLTPFERYQIMREGATNAQPLSSIHSPDVLGKMASRTIPAEEAIMGEISSLPVGLEYLQGTPASRVFQSSQAELAKKLAMREALRQSAISPGELGMVSAMGAAGGTGGYLGMR